MSAPSSKRRKNAGCVHYGERPKTFSGEILTMTFHVHDFASLQQKRNHYISTEAISAHSHSWRLRIYPRGGSNSSTDTENVSVYLYPDGSGSLDEAQSVLVKAKIRTETSYSSFSEARKFTNTNAVWGWPDFAKREEVLSKDCDKDGTLTIGVDIEVATKKSPTWYPKQKSSDNICKALYESASTSDITITVGKEKREFMVHKCFLAHGAKVLYDIVAEQSHIALPGVDAIAFEAMLKFIYTGEEPEALNNDDESAAKEILLLADRFDCTDLKLYAESVITDKILIPANAARLLLFADSHACALLKESCMNAYSIDPKGFMESHEDWKKLSESNKLLLELLAFNSTGRKQYSPCIGDGEETVEDVDGLDVVSLRERLCIAELDVDGSREMLVDRWKQQLAFASRS